LLLREDMLPEGKNVLKKRHTGLQLRDLANMWGASLGHNRLMFQGLFMAPHVVAESLKGAVFALGYGGVGF